MDDLETAIESLCFGLVAITARAIDEASTHPALTFQQWRILVVIGSVPDGARVTDVGKRIGASGPSTSRLASRLEARGLVSSVEDSRDRRVTRLHLTDDGADLRRRVIDLRRELIRSTIASWRSEPRLASGITRLAAEFDRWI